MSVGVVVPLPAYTLDPAFIAQKAEQLGFESIWYHEHPILPVKSDSPFLSTGGEIPWTYRHFSEPYISLAIACAVTTKIKIGTGITLVPERNPLILADYRIATRGRVTLAFLVDEIELLPRVVDRPCSRMAGGRGRRPAVGMVGSDDVSRRRRPRS